MNKVKTIGKKYKEEDNGDYQTDYPIRKEFVKFHIGSSHFMITIVHQAFYYS